MNLKAKAERLVELHKLKDKPTESYYHNGDIYKSFAYNHASEIATALIKCLEFIEKQKEPFEHDCQTCGDTNDIECEQYFDKFLKDLETKDK